MTKLSPSILSADFSRLGEEVAALEKYGADMAHIDVMDGMFVPNISFGFPIIRDIRKISNLTFDAHLMIEEPSRYIEEFSKYCDIITIHYESDRHADRTINYIKSFGKKAGIAINPATPVCIIKDIIGQVDLVLIMSVNPGFGGQSFIPYTLEKIAEVKRIAEEVNPSLMIEVDGGIGADNLKQVIEKGANVIVAGSAVFKDNKIEENIKLLKEGF